MLLNLFPRLLARGLLFLVLRVKAGERSLKLLSLEVGFLFFLFELRPQVPESGLTAGALVGFVFLTYRFLEPIAEFTELIEPLSLDEAFLDMTGTERLHRAPPAVMLAGLVKRMEDELGLTGFVITEERRGLTAIDGYGLLGARLMLSNLRLGNRGTLDIALWGKNLTDTDYEAFTLDNLPQASRAVIWGEGRTYGLEVIYRYD